MNVGDNPLPVRAKETSTGWAFLYEALRDHPVKRLTRGALWSERDGCHCLMGAVTPEELWRDPEEEKMYVAATYLVRERDIGPYYFKTPEIAAWAKEHGLSPHDVNAAEELNDANRRETPEERYTRVLESLRRRAEKSEETR